MSGTELSREFDNEMQATGGDASAARNRIRSRVGVSDRGVVEGAATAWKLYCGAHTSVSLVSDGDQGECGNEFVYEGDSEREWTFCPSCGAEVEIIRDHPVADREALLEHIRQLEKQLLGAARGGRGGGES